MNKDLRIAILPAIELRIGLRRLIDGDLVADDEGGLGAAGDDHVAQVAVIGLHVALPGSYC